MDPDTQDVEIIEPAGENGGQVIINLEGLIKNHISAIDKLQEEVRKK